MDLEKKTIRPVWKSHERAGAGAFPGLQEFPPYGANYWFNINIRPLQACGGRSGRALLVTFSFATTKGCLYLFLSRRHCSRKNTQTQLIHKTRKRQWPQNGNTGVLYARSDGVRATFYVTFSNRPEVGRYSFDIYRHCVGIRSLSVQQKMAPICLLIHQASICVRQYVHRTSINAWQMH